MLRNLLSKIRKEKVGCISICLLQQKPDPLSEKRLDSAMKRAWRREHDPQRFFVVSIDDEWSLLKIDDHFVTIRHVDRALQPGDLGDQEVPGWALHSTYSAIAYECPGGVPEGEVRDAFYGLLALLAAELVTPDTSAFFFAEEKTFVPMNQEVLKRLRAGQPLNPSTLLA